VKLPQGDEAERVLEQAAAKAREAEKKHRDAAPSVLGTKLPLSERIARLKAKAASGPAAQAVDDTQSREADRQWIEQLMSISLVPANYVGADLFNVENIPEPSRAAYLKKSRQLAGLMERSGIVVLLGNVGTGKTHMACALVQAFCRQRRRAMYAEAMDYFIDLQESYGQGAGTTPRKVENKYLLPELLILDAMEERADTPWNDRMLFRLVNKRYAAGQSTVLISNEQEKEFNARVGASIADRIRDGGGRIICNWKSLRGNVAGSTAP
jgi:DNA replication protein DnaC